VPGVGVVVASVTGGCVGNLDRSANLAALRTYTGLVPRENSSGGAERRSKISKAGPSMLRWSLYFAVDTARKWDPELAELYWRLMVERGRLSPGRPDLGRYPREPALPSGATSPRRRAITGNRYAPSISGLSSIPTPANGSGNSEDRTRHTRGSQRLLMTTTGPRHPTSPATHLRTLTALDIRKCTSSHLRLLNRFRAGSSQPLQTS
jgi:hypothetical protein